MSSGYKYFLGYLTMVIVVSWTILITWINFQNELKPFVGTINMSHPLIIFILYLPSITGLTIGYIVGGKKGIKNMLLKIIPQKKDLFWFPVIFGIFVLYELVIHYGCLIFGIPLPEITMSIPEIVIRALKNFIDENMLGTAFGWVGFVLPFLQGKLRNNIYAALLTALLFGIWVFPGYGVSSGQGLISYALYVAMLMSFLVFISYIFNATKGNLGFYLIAFWLAGTGSHIQLYHFNIPVQIIEISFFCFMTVLIHFILKSAKKEYSLVTFPDYILGDKQSGQTLICDESKNSSVPFYANKVK